MNNPIRRYFEQKRTAYKLQKEEAATAAANRLYPDEALHAHANWWAEQISYFNSPEEASEEMISMQRTLFIHTLVGELRKMTIDHLKGYYPNFEKTEKFYDCYISLQTNYSPCAELKFAMEAASISHKLTLFSQPLPIHAWSGMQTGGKIFVNVGGGEHYPLKFEAPTLN